MVRIIDEFQLYNIAIEVVESQKEMGIRAAEIIADKIIKKPNIVLGLPTGSTPIPVYAELINYYAEGLISFKEVKTFNLDEYYPIEPSNYYSYQSSMRRDLFSHIDIPAQNIHFPDCLSPYPIAASANYEALIKKSGGIDVLLSGIGHNSHIAFNEPPTQKDSRTRLVALSDETRNINSRFFKSIEEVPKYAITMGLGTILEAKEIILCACGVAKSEAIYRVFGDKPHSDFPASYLQNHQNCRFILDRTAASKIVQ